ncbi:MAG: hypothetical protein PVG65_00705 [Candidatus Thorarchaeota archaeon]|jgi:hypothetical protein
MIIKELRINENFSKIYTCDVSAYGEGEKSIDITNNKFIETDVLLDRMNASFGAPKSRELVIPRNCRLIKKLSSRHTVYVIEQDPEIRTIIASVNLSGALSKLKTQGKLIEFGYKNLPARKRKQKYTLAFPFIEYIMVFNTETASLSTLMVFLRHLPLQGIGDILYKIPLYNISENQAVCLGRGEYYISIDEAIIGVINRFWGSTFNEDYVTNVISYENNQYVGDLLSWQHYTKVDPMFVYNVDWVPHKRNLKEILLELGDVYISRRKHNEKYYGISNFSEITRLFDKSSSVTNLTKTDSTKIYDNMANYINLGNGINLFIEDEIIIKGKRFFVISFLGKKCGNISHVRLLSPSNKKIIMKLTKQVVAFLRKKTEEQRCFHTATIKGTKIKAGDIVEIDSYGVKGYKELQYLRYSFDGKVEAKLGKDFYLLENIKNIKKVNLKDPEIDGIKLKKGNEYLLTTGTVSGLPSQVAFCGRYIGMGVHRNGNLQAKFIDTNTGSERLINYSNNIWTKTYDHNKLEKIPKIFMHGTRLYGLVDKYTNESDAGLGYFHPTNGIIKKENCKYVVPNFNDVISELLINGGKTLKVKSFNYTLEFSVGDWIVISDWDNPTEMIKPKTITEFKTEDSGKLYINAKSDDGSIISYPFIEQDTLRQYTSPNYMFIKTGTVRHITNEYNGIRSGTMIKSNKPRICNFPQKDINMIIGFLTDTGGDIPLVLCSNCCTIWPDQLKEDFEIIPTDDSEQNKLTISPIDLTKIKLQPGDIIITSQRISSDPVILFSNPYNRGIRYIRTSLYKIASQPQIQTFNNETRRNAKPFGFLSPRYTQNQWMEFEKVEALPNFYGMFVKNRLSILSFDLDERRFLNV